MDILKLRYFLVVARCENMTKAAESLHVAQPAISQAIKKLDDELGVKLFDRVGRNIQLSDTGKLFYSKVEPLVKALDDIPQILTTEVGKKSKTIKVNISAVPELVTSIIADYKENNPEINFVLSQDENDWDIKVSSINNTEGNDITRTALTEKIMLAVPKKSKFSNAETIKLMDAKHSPFVGLHKDYQFPVLTASFCLATGFDPSVVFEAESPQMLMRLVEADVGVAFWPEFSWGPVDDNKVQLISISDPKCAREIYVTKREKAINTQLMDSVFEYLSSRISAIGIK